MDYAITKRHWRAGATPRSFSAASKCTCSSSDPAPSAHSEAQGTGFPTLCTVSISTRTCTEETILVRLKGSCLFTSLRSCCKKISYHQHCFNTRIYSRVHVSKRANTQPKVSQPPLVRSFEPPMPLSLHLVLKISTLLTDPCEDLLLWKDYVSIERIAVCEVVIPQETLHLLVHLVASVVASCA